jgi:hypothetical protein
MFRKISILVATIVICTTGYAHAFFIPQLRSAETLGWGSLGLSTGIGIYENALTVFGNARYGIASPVDVSLTIGLMDHDASDDASVVVGADVQYQVADTDLGKSVDIAIGGVVQYFAYDVGMIDVSVWSLGANLIVSKPLQVENGLKFTPYGRLNLRSDNIDADFNSTGSSSDSEFNIGITLGSQFHFSGNFNISAEVQIDDQIGAIGALNFFMW